MCLLLGSVEKVEFFFGGSAGGGGLLGAALDDLIASSSEGVNVEFAKLQGDVIFDLIGGSSSSSSSGGGGIRVAVGSSGVRRIVGLKESRFRNTGAHCNSEIAMLIIETQTRF